MTELRCSRELALRLGAVEPVSVRQHRELRDAGHLLVRDVIAVTPLFWPWQLTGRDMASTRSS